MSMNRHKGHLALCQLKGETIDEKADDLLKTLGYNLVFDYDVTSPSMYIDDALGTHVIVNDEIYRIVQTTVFVNAGLRFHRQLNGDIEFDGHVEGDLKQAIHRSKIKGREEQ